jgi:DMSO/TMAO reductase YedYZ molybdopterin-dependent catalytic subunit
MKKTLSITLTLLFIFVLAACQVAPAVVATVEAPTAAASADNAEVVLTLVGDSTAAFTMDDLKKMPVVEGQAGLKSSTGKIFPPQPYKGVLLSDLVKLAGGDNSSMGVQIEAKDGYSMTLSYDQINKGDFITYNPGTGDETKSGGELKTILAYEVNGKPLDVEQDGALRLMVVSAEPNQVVDGHWSVKFVTKLTVKPLAEEWSLLLEGAIKDEIDRGSFESCSASTCHQSSYTDDKGQEWVGAPLYLFAGRVDDENKHEGDAFSTTIAEKGYTIEIIAKDGYSVSLDSIRVMNNPNYIVAFTMNGNVLDEKSFPLQLVGPDLQKNEKIGGIAKIVLHMNDSAASVEATTEPTVESKPADAIAGAALSFVGLVDQPLGWSRNDLEAMDVVKMNVEHPKKGSIEVEGVRLNALIELVKVKPEAKTLVVTSSDGYVTEIGLADVVACADCMVAFEDDGSLKLAMPGMQSNFWAKAVVKIEAK